MDVTIRHVLSPLQGTFTVPPDKAICHRAVLMAALAKGETVIRPWPAADDCQRTLELMQALGVSVTRSGPTVRIRGVEGEMRTPSEDLFCGESGTTLRIASGLLAGVPGVRRLTASPALCRRPMRRIVEPLSRMGVHVTGAAGGRPSSEQEVYPPLTIHGRRPLRAIRYEMPVASAQVKSAVLLAGLSGDGPTSVVEPRQTRDHTERMLRQFGATVRVQQTEVSIEPGPLRSPGELELPGDFSSAAFLIVAAATIPDSRIILRDVSLNPTRIALLDLLTRMGAKITWTIEETSWEPRGTIVVEARPLRGLTLAAEEVPDVIDELPILMVAAACAAGTTRLPALGELRVKETDRIHSMVHGLRQLGVRLQVIEPDTVEIEGGPMRGTTVESAGDHRTAMSLSIAGLVAEGTTTIHETGCVAKSFPGFFDRLRDLVGAATITDGKNR